jgi:uncharacterized cupredoxin-like copper-binding protein
MKHIAAVLAISVAAIGTTSAGAVAGRTASGNTAVHVVLGKPSEMRFTLDRTTVPHGAVVFQLVNKGVVAHDLRIAGKSSKLVPPRGTATLSVTLPKPGRYPYECTVPGHAAAGMKGVLKVT